MKQISYQLYRGGELIDSDTFASQHDAPQAHALEIAEDSVFEEYFGDDSVERWISEGEDFGNGSYQFVIRFCGETLDDAVTVNLTIK